MKEGIGGNSGSSSGTQFPGGTQLICPSLLFPLPELPFRHLGPRVFLSQGLSSHIRNGEEAKYRLAATPIGKEVSDREPAISPSRLLPPLCPQDLLPRLPLGGTT